MQHPVGERLEVGERIDVGIAPEPVAVRAR
jgi:hypothetical protein